MLRFCSCQPSRRHLENSSPSHSFAHVGLISRSTCSSTLSVFSCGLILLPSRWENSFVWERGALEGSVPIFPLAEACGFIHSTGAGASRHPSLKFKLGWPVRRPTRHGQPPHGVYTPTPQQANCQGPTHPPPNPRKRHSRAGQVHHPHPPWNAPLCTGALWRGGAAVVRAVAPSPWHTPTPPPLPSSPCSAHAAALCPRARWWRRQQPPTPTPLLPAVRHVG